MNALSIHTSGELSRISTICIGAGLFGYVANKDNAARWMGKLRMPYASKHLLPFTKMIN